MRYLPVRPDLMEAVQSSGVASAATPLVGNEAAVFKAVFKHSIIPASVVGTIVML